MPQGDHHRGRTLPRHHARGRRPLRVPHGVGPNTPTIGEHRLPRKASASAPDSSARKGAMSLTRAAAARTTARPWRRRPVRTTGPCFRPSSRAGVSQASAEPTASGREQQRECAVEARQRSAEAWTATVRTLERGVTPMLPRSKNRRRTRRLLHASVVNHCSPWPTPSGSPASSQPRLSQSLYRSLRRASSVATVCSRAKRQQSTRSGRRLTPLASR